SGRQYDVVGSFTARPPFATLTAGLWCAAAARTPTRAVHVVVTSVAAARATEALTLLALAPPAASRSTVRSATALADLQRAVQGDLGDYGRDLLALTLGGGAFLIAVVVLAEVLLRRRDLGRRRALGASRRDVATLVLLRTIAAAIPGALTGTAAGVAAAAAWADQPPADFTAATATLTILVAATVAVAPSVLAARRDPVGVLRTP